MIIAGKPIRVFRLILHSSAGYSRELHTHTHTQTVLHVGAF